MVLKNHLGNLGFGGVEVDTVLSAPITRPGDALTGQVHLRATGDVEITSIALLVVAAGGSEVELARHVVGQRLRLSSGSNRAVPFSVATPVGAPVTVIDGQVLPGISVGVRTEVSVAGGSARTDFDPAGVEPSTLHQQILDVLGTIGCRFVRTELRPGTLVGLALPVVQSITFYAPVPQGQPVGPHIPQLVFSFAGDVRGLTVVAEPAGSSGAADQHRVTPADIESPSVSFVDKVDGWVRQALDRLSEPSAAAAVAFPQQTPAAGPHHPTHGQPGHEQPAYGQSVRPARPRTARARTAGVRPAGVRAAGVRAGAGALRTAGLPAVGSAAVCRPGPTGWVPVLRLPRRWRRRDDRRWRRRRCPWLLRRRGHPRRDDPPRD